MQTRSFFDSIALLKTVFLSISVLSGTLTFSSDTIHISEEADYFVQNNSMDFLLDREGNFSIHQVSSKSFQNKFSSQVPSSEKETKVYWIRIVVRAGSLPNAQWVLEHYNSYANKIEVFGQDRGIYKSYGVVGSTALFSSRKIRYKNPTYEIKLHNGVQSFYIRLETQYYQSFVFSIKSYPVFINNILKNIYWYGGYYFMLLLMILYNLFIYISLRDKIYLFYILYILACFFDSVKVDFTGFAFFWPEYPFLNDIIYKYSRDILIVCLVLYAKSFLNISKNLPRFNLYINAVLIIHIAYSLLNKTPWVLYLEGIQLTMFGIIFSLVYTSAIKLFIAGHKTARFFILGFSILVAGFIIYYLWINLLLPTNEFTMHVLYFAILFEAIVFSYALSDKLGIEKKEKQESQRIAIGELKKNKKLQEMLIRELEEKEAIKDKVNRELESKIRDRTKELHESNALVKEANLKLQEQADKINEMNRILDLDNYKLKADIKEVAKARVLKYEVKFEDFNSIFPNKDSCFKFLEELKWQRNYECKKCHNNKYIPGQGFLSRRCTKCGYNESVTSGTIFHGIKFPVEKAFYITYLVYSTHGKITSVELSEALDMRQKTCWHFRKVVIDEIARKEELDIEKNGWEYLILT
ncbi:MAG: hypothetical protein K2X86_14545 [Cytophagaceae bacterium]|nr:hypothetical protein [Cytophagaceae bacterium]